VSFKVTGWDIMFICGMLLLVLAWVWTSYSRSDNCTWL